MRTLLMKKIIILLVFLAATNLLANAEAGKKVYATYCAMCHTADGGQAYGPDFNIVSYTRKKKEIEDYTREPYAFYGAFGYSANAMPTLPLEDQEIKDVADYIDSLQPFKKWMKKKEN